MSALAPITPRFKARAKVRFRTIGSKGLHDAREGRVVEVIYGTRGYWVVVEVKGVGQFKVRPSHVEIV